MGAGASAYASVDAALADGKTQEEVDAFHARYVAALVSLYDRHKGTYYGAAAASLEVF